MNKKDTENQNLITIMVPTYNRLDKLKRCIESIENQTYTNFDLGDRQTRSIRRTLHWKSAI